jgi:hypothetical protein
LKPSCVQVTADGITPTQVESATLRERSPAIKVWLVPSLMSLTPMLLLR